MKKLFMLAALLASTGAKSSDRSIIGGDKVETGKYPFMVSILHSDNDLWEGHFCGGSLIEEDIVLTAAHCLVGESPRTIEVSAGRTSLAKGVKGGQRRRVKRIIMHENYNYRTVNNDIGLIILEEAFELNDSVGLIDYEPTNIQLGDLTVIGWGNTSTSQSNFPRDLMEVDVKFIDTELCNARRWMNGRVTENMFCAGYRAGAKDSCQGDSGGPIFLKSDSGDFIQAGIVSWGEGCARRRRPGIYTKLSNYSDWIANKLESR